KEGVMEMGREREGGRERGQRRGRENVCRPQVATTLYHKTKALACRAVCISPQVL
ncbi:uncharacterized protein LACBIDRAFT_302681, partial [Laccaria bicolor S238N-H82]